MPNPVSFLVPILNYNSKDPYPTSGSLTTSIISITGPDFTEIKIPIGVTYTKNSSTNQQHQFTGPSDNSKTFIFIFPKGTIHNSSTTGKYTDIYTTPSKINYNFENKYTTNTTDSGTTVEVTSGSIIINNISSSSNINSSTDYTPKSVENMMKDNIKKAGKQVTERIESTIYDTFNINFLTLIYTLLKDFIVIITIWLFVINIGVWGTVDADLVHPIDVTKYPYTYNDGESINNLRSFAPTESGVFCGKLKQEDIGKISSQLREQLQKQPDIKEKLESINPIMSEISPKNIYYISKTIQSICSTTSSYSNAFSVLIYWLSYLVFTQTVHQNYLLNTFHALLNKIIKITTGLFSSESYFASITLAFIIFGIYEALKPTTSSLKKMFGVKITDNFIKKPSSIFTYGCIHILSILLFVALPLFFILFAVGLLSHIQNILKIIIESNSVECAFLSFIALTTTIVTFFQVLYFIIDRNTSGFTLINFQEQVTKYLNFSNLFNLIANGAGVCIPLGIALFSAFVIPSRIILTSIYMFKRKIELLKNLSPAIMILLFYFLFNNVYHILGPAQAYVTLSVICFFGFYFMTKK